MQEQEGARAGGRRAVRMRKLLIYLLSIGLPLFAVLGVLHFGEQGGLAGRSSSSSASESAGDAARVAPEGLSAHGADGLDAPLPRLLLQILVVLVAARGCGRLFARYGQPAVIGEMLAGILLGPSLLGWLWPASSELLFPADSLAPLRLLSQLGVILFMFVVGLELDWSQLRHRLRVAVWVSHASIVVPFLLGSLLSLLLYPRFAAGGASFTAFALFVGVAMSITAFPVLARILEERGLARTGLGSIAIACAAVGDVTAWCLLALVVAIAKAQALSGVAATLLLTLAFAVVMLGPVRRLAARWVPRREGDERQQRSVLAGALALLLLGALASELIGIHALFGAFLAGAVMPRHSGVVESLRRRLESFSAVFLLPLFFAFTGLRTQVGLLREADAWFAFAAVLAVAMVGKLGGTMLAARMTGMSWLDAYAIGALMNTRGLVELIVLDLGYELGILSPAAFAMMVLMALLTTALTGPLLQLHAALARRAEADVAAATASA
jgi:Kef-type K+ transport system membrane component KefB